MSTATAAQYENGQDFAADDVHTALPLRSDTFLGVCEAIGRDFGFNPNWLRLVFAPIILLNPLAAIGAYLGLGAFVAASHWLFPAGGKPAQAETTAAEEKEEERLAA